VRIPQRAIKGTNFNGTRIGRRRYSFRIIKLSNGEEADVADSPEIVDCRNLGIVVSKSRYGTSRLRSLTNHYKFIENNLIPGCGSNKKLSRTSFARFSGADFDRSRAPTRLGLSKHTSIRLSRSQINTSGFKYGNPNSDVWKCIRADNPDKARIRGYSNTLSKRHEIELRSHFEINRTRGGYVR